MIILSLNHSSCIDNNKRVFFILNITPCSTGTVYETNCNTVSLICNYTHKNVWQTVVVKYVSDAKSRSGRYRY